MIRFIMFVMLIIVFHSANAQEYILEDTKSYKEQKKKERTESDKYKESRRIRMIGKHHVLFGAKLGYNSFETISKYDDSYFTYPGVNFLFSAMYERSVFRHYCYVGAGVEYEHYLFNEKLHINYGESESTYSGSMNYVNIPLAIKLRMSQFYFGVTAGPSFNLRGRVDLYDEKESDFTSVDIENICKFRWFMTCELGAYWGKHFVLGAYLKTGSNIVKDTESHKSELFSPIGIGLSFAYRLPL